jgi:hypothetical protein
MPNEEKKHKVKISSNLEIERHTRDDAFFAAGLHKFKEKEKLDGIGISAQETDALLHHVYPENFVDPVHPINIQIFNKPFIICSAFEMKDEQKDMDIMFRYNLLAILTNRDENAKPPFKICMPFSFSGGFVKHAMLIEVNVDENKVVTITLKNPLGKKSAYNGPCLERICPQLGLAVDLVSSLGYRLNEKVIIAETGEPNAKQTDGKSCGICLLKNVDASVSAIEPSSPSLMKDAFGAQAFDELANDSNKVLKNIQDKVVKPSQATDDSAYFDSARDTWNDIKEPPTSEELLKEGIFKSSWDERSLMTTISQVNGLKEILNPEVKLKIFKSAGEGAIAGILVEGTHPFAMRLMQYLQAKLNLKQNDFDIIHVSGQPASYVLKTSAFTGDVSDVAEILQSKIIGEGLFVEGIIKEVEVFKIKDGDTTEIEDIAKNPEVHAAKDAALLPEFNNILMPEKIVGDIEKIKYDVTNQELEFLEITGDGAKELAEQLIALIKNDKYTASLLSKPGGVYQVCVEKSPENTSALKEAILSSSWNRPHARDIQNQIKILMGELPLPQLAKLVSVPLASEQSEPKPVSPLIPAPLPLNNAPVVTASTPASGVRKPAAFAAAAGIDPDKFKKAMEEQAKINKYGYDPNPWAAHPQPSPNCEFSNGGIKQFNINVRNHSNITQAFSPGSDLTKGGEMFTKALLEGCKDSLGPKQAITLSFAGDRDPAQTRELANAMIKELIDAGRSEASIVIKCDPVNTTLLAQLTSAKASLVAAAKLPITPPVVNPNNTGAFAPDDFSPDKVKIEFVGTSIKASFPVLPNMLKNRNRPMITSCYLE